VAGGRQRLTSAERRAAIVRAAIELFSKNGFRGTTTRELAAAVGVSEPVLYQHFATKSDLYTAILERMLDDATAVFNDALEQLVPEATEEEFFTWLGNLILNWYIEGAGNVRLLLFGALEGHELASQWHEKAVTQCLDFVNQFIERRTAEGRFRPLRKPVAAEAFVAMAAHYGLVTGLFPARGNGISRDEAVAGFVDIYLNGIRSRDEF
jgi:AcrR family transcriptional regulator